MRLNTISSKRNNLTQMIRCNHLVLLFRSLFACCRCSYQCTQRDTTIIFMASNCRNSKTFCIFCSFYWLLFGPFSLAIFSSVCFGFSYLVADIATMAKNLVAMCRKVQKSIFKQFEIIKCWSWCNASQCINIWKSRLDRTIRQIRDNRQ